MLICCHLHSFLNLAKTALKGSVNRLTRTEQIVHGNDGGALQVLYDGRRRLAVNHLEGRHSRAHVLGRVVGPFCKREESKPLRRVLMNLRPQILFEGPINNLGFAVHLRVVRRAHTELRTTELEQLTSKMADKHRVSVRHDTTGKPVKLADAI